MAYGVKRGMKAPGEFGIGDILGLGLSGAAGIIAALVTDYQQQGEASALFTINQWVVSAGQLLGVTDIPLWVVVAGMTMIGAGSIFYFQPITRQGAFAQGFGLLAVLMTATPADLAGGIEAINDINDNLPGLEAPTTNEASLGGGVIHAAYKPGEARVYLAQSRSSSKYDVRITINFPDGLKDDVDTMIRKQTLRGRLHNEKTDETWNLFRSSGGTVTRQGDSLVIRAGVPARFQETTLHVRIEAEGYKIEEQSATATLNRRLNWTVDMEPSSTPLFIQRLGKSYWF